MKKVIYLLLVVAILSFVYVNQEKYKSFFASLHPCDNPITYRVDTVDPKFNLSRDKFKARVAEAASVWNGQRDLFVYDENGKVSVNLIFDERQASTNKINQLNKELEEKKGKLDEQIKEYQAQVANFKVRLAAYNQKVQSWNSRGGAPSGEFEKLNQEQSELQSEADKLNDLAKKLNLSGENYNLGVGNLNSAVGEFNEDLEKKPEEGIFIGETNRIEIYFNNSQPELVHTLAHELGHSIGIEHVGNQKAIMYPYSTKTIALTADDVSELTEVCRDRSILEVVNFRLNL